jgi:protein SCO1/2
MSSTAIPTIGVPGRALDLNPPTTEGPLLMSRRTVATIIVLLLLVVTSTFIWIGKSEAYVFNGGEMRPAKAAGALDLTDQNGVPFSLSQLTGDVVVVYFGYTTCPDLCPTTLSDFTAVKSALGARASQVKFLMVSLDPERDTLPVLKRYLAFFDPEFIGLRGDTQQTAAVEAEYGVIAKRVDYPDSATKYLIDHTALIYVIDPQGRFKLTYPYGTDPALIAQDIQHLMS